MSGRPVAVVTGATGFLGRHLTRRLLDDDWSVHAIVRAGSRVQVLPTAARAVVTDGVSDVLTATRDLEPDVFFHLAGRFVSEHRSDNVEDLIRSNVELGAAIAESASVAGSALVTAGSHWQHVGGAVYRPASLYAATKQAFDDILEFYAEAGVPAASLHVCDTYGPNDDRGKLVASLIAAAATGTELELSPGEQLIDLMYVDDVVNAFVCAARTIRQRPRQGLTRCAVSSDAPLTIRDLVVLVNQVTGKPVRAKWASRPYRRFEMFETWVTLPRVDGWMPLVRLELGLRRVWAHFQQQ